MNTLRTFFVLSAVALLAACGSNIGAPAGPCEGFDPAEGCGGVCQIDENCDPGFYCNGSTCTADCTLGGPECGEGGQCSDNGRCIPASGPDTDGTGGTGGTGGDGDGPDCPSIAVNLDAVTPTVQLVIDQSGSMDENFGNGLDRWEAVGAAQPA